METSEKQNTEESFADKKVWDKAAKVYSDLFEINTLQANIVLYTQTRSKYGRKIVEVGVGAGISARAFVLLYMQPGAVYYNSDISPGMIDLFEKNFIESELGKWDTIKISLLDELSNHTIEDYDSTTQNKRIFATVANNEKLPYPDTSFDRYISNLSLMIVDNHMNQLNEAYRVLESGGIAGFSVIGREENSQHLAVPQEAFIAFGLEPPPFAKNIMHLNDPTNLKKDLESVGFSKIKLFFCASHISHTKEEHYNFFFNFGPFSNKLKELSQDKIAEFQNIYYNIFEEKFGSDSTSPVTLEVLIAICKKP